MTHYTAIVFISALAMLIMIFCLRVNRVLPTVRRRCFQLLFTLLIVVNLAEWLAASLNGVLPQWRPVHIAAKFTELLFTPIVPVVAMKAIGGKEASGWALAPVVLNTALQVTSLFAGIVYTVDAASVYTRGPLYLLYAATFSVEALMLILHCLRFSSRYQFANISFLSLINLLILLAVGLEFAAPYLRLDWVCVSYAAIFFYIYYDQLVQQVDPLTTLLNRRSFDCAVRRLRAPATVIFFDVDHFKEVNDVYGHPFGDVCLVSIAQAIKSVFEKHGYCYRFGGDEFFVILRRNTGDVDASISAFLAQIQALRAQDPRIPGVSAGHATFDPAVETIDQSIAEADERMYRFKERSRSASHS